MDLKAILADLNICEDVIKIILEYNATLLGFVPLEDGSISVQHYESKKEWIRLKLDAYTVPNIYDFYHLHFNDSHSDLLLMPEINCVLRLQAHFHVRIWDFHTGLLLLSRLISFSRETAPVEFMFWIPQLKKVVLIDRVRIHTLTIDKEEKQVRCESIHQECKHEELIYAEPILLHPFEFFVVYDVDFEYEDKVKMFNVQSQQLYTVSNKTAIDRCRIEKILPFSKTCSLVLLTNKDEKKTVSVAELATQIYSNVHFKGIVHRVLDLELVDIVHIIDNKYRFSFYSQNWHPPQIQDTVCVLKFKEGQYSFETIKKLFQRDPVKAVVLSEDHYFQPNSHFDSLNSTMMYPISFLLLSCFLWYFFC